MAKIRDLVERVLKQSDGIITEDGLVAIAEQGVNYIVYGVLTDPENAAQIERIAEPRYGMFLYNKSLYKVSS
jgi:nicotinate-nucleotide pyrophosphorylase